MTLVYYSRTYLTDKRDDWKPFAYELARQLWAAGKGTKAIANELGVHESEVWVRMDKIKLVHP